MVAVVTWGCLTPSPPEIGFSFPEFDKLEHLVAYLGMSAWFAAAVTTRRDLRWVVACFVIMGGLIEIVQGLSGYRDAEWLDWVADCLGVAAGVWRPKQYLHKVYMHLMGMHAAGA
jgi:VanZ family protein